MKIHKLLRGAIAASTLALFAGTTTVAQASPWNWAKRAEHGVVDRVEHAAVGVASIATGVAAMAAAPAVAMAGMAGAMVSDSLLGLLLVGYAAPVVLAAAGVAAVGFGGYELYKSADGAGIARGIGDLATDGYNGVRNAFTKVHVVDLPLGGPILLPNDGPNAGFHH